MTVEADVIAFLTEHVGVPVFATVPRERPTMFVTVERVGGRLDQFRDLPQFAVQAWAPTTAKAAALADNVRFLLPDLIGLPDVGRVNIGSTYNYPDPDSGQARYQTVFDLTVKVAFAV